MEQNARKSATLSDVLSGRHFVRIADSQEKECALYRHELEKNFSIGYAISKLKVKLSALTSLLSGTPAQLVFIVGGFMVIKNEITLGTLIAVSMYYSRLSTLIIQLADMNLNWQPAIAALERINDLMLLGGKDVDRTSCSPARSRLSSFISLEKASAGYAADCPVMRDISINIPKGKITAIVGGSGTGKSTLLKALTGALPLSAGSVLWDGNPLSLEQLRSYRRTIGFVPKDAFLFSRTLRENVLYHVLDNEQHAKLAIERLAQSGVTGINEETFDRPISERGGNVSAGEQQRIAIVRETMKSPPVLILDEAMANLDSHSEILLIDTLRTWGGCDTMILVSHRLSTILRADHLIVLKNGRVCCEGPASEIISRCEEVRRVFRGQLHIPASDSA